MGYEYTAEEKELLECLATKEKIVRERYKSYILKSLKYFLDHPAIAGSLIYIFFSTIGVLYSLTLYNQFSINILDYTETNDFLMAAFKDFDALLMTVVIIIITGGLVILFSLYGISLVVSISNNKVVSCLALIFPFFLLFGVTFLIVTFFGYEQYKSIIEGKRPTVTVSFKEKEEKKK
jgi:hypothetical protein